MTLEIVQFGHDVLLEKGKPIEKFDDELKILFEDMVNTTIEAEGIGLAAQQIGKAVQFCIVDLRDCEIDFEYTIDGSKPPVDLFMPIGMCNPTLEFIKDKKTTSYEEGCLSFPNIRGDVERPDWVRCKFQDVDGFEHVIECNGLLSRCIQHEVDHLNGILFIDRMKKRAFKKIQLAINQCKVKTLQRLKR